MQLADQRTGELEQTLNDLEARNQKLNQELQNTCQVLLYTQPM